MGAWGPALFSDDTAADTRDAFTDFIAEGMTPEQATEQLVAESAEILADAADANVFWLSLAATQWKLGRLLDPVRERAIEIIDSGIDLQNWHASSPKVIRQREKNLAKLREQLTSPQPKPKKLKPFLKSSTDFQVGDVASFRLDESTAVRFCVLHLGSDRGGTYADIVLLGLEDGSHFDKQELALEETLGPRYTMIYHELEDSITMLSRGVKVPDRTPQASRLLYNSPLDGHACTWDDFPQALRTMLPKLGW